MPHSKLNLLRLLPPKSMLCFLSCPQPKMSVSPCTCVCVCLCLCACAFQTISRWNLLQIAATMKICIKFPYAFLLCCPWCLPLPLSLPRLLLNAPPLPSYRFRYNFATICIKCTARLTDKFHVSLTKIYELLKIFTGYFVYFFFCGPRSRIKCVL